MRNPPTPTSLLTNTTLQRWFWLCTRWHMDVIYTRQNTNSYVEKLKKSMSVALKETNNELLVSLIATYSGRLTSIYLDGNTSELFIPDWCCLIWGDECFEPPICPIREVCYGENSAERLRDIILGVCEDYGLHNIHEWLPLPTNPLHERDLWMIIGDEELTMRGRYYKCTLCGRFYHSSDGGCICEDLLKESSCKCTAEEWTNDGDRIICLYCEEEPKKV